MPSITTRADNDPVSQHISRLTSSAGRHPVPLTSTRYDIEISGGLASVLAVRTFLNSEKDTIEASLTFPLPVDAVLFALEARIGERLVTAVAQGRRTARETYEDAVDRGKTSVLHEELMPGLHLLNVAHVPPGTAIEVSARFVLPVSWLGGRALVRIPTTVGDIYGSSGLEDCDEILHGGPVMAADVAVSSSTGTPRLLSGRLVDGKARLSLDEPIVIEIEGWTAEALSGCAADGARVTLEVAPASVHSASIDVAVLVDRSGSMAERCASGAGLTKHAAVLLGLTEAQEALEAADRLNLWQFCTVAEDLGTATGDGWRGLLRCLSEPAGGTEIGGALQAVLAARPVGDILVVTDGKSHALDVQALARSGARFTVVLIGEDSLEANVGHLAVLSGGQIFVAAQAEVTGAVKGAIASLRAPRLDPKVHAEGLSSVRALRAGMDIRAAWGPKGSEAPADGASRPGHAVAAFAASLLLPTLSEAAAEALAVAEGLVTHLTSLVLVDEEGAEQAGLPAMRKVALPTPHTAAQPVAADFALGDIMFACADRSRMKRSLRVPSQRVDYSRSYADVDLPIDAALCSPLPAARPSMERRLEEKSNRSIFQDPAAPESRHGAAKDLKEESIRSLAHLPRRIDWRSEGQRLAEGNMIGLDPEIADLIDESARYGIVRRAAKRLGLSPRLLVIGLLARRAAADNRFADRVARAVLAKAKTSDIAAVADKLGLGLGRAAA